MLVFVFMMLFFAAMFGQIQVGHAVILVDPLTRSISEPIIGPSYYVKLPWVTAVTIYFATDVYEDTIPCFSSDQLEMRITVLIRWQLDVTKIRDLYQSFPRLDYEETVIDSIAEETIRLITKEYTALDTIKYRDVLAERIQEEVFKKIEESELLKGALGHLEFDLKNIAYPESYTRAIENKLIAEQQKIQAEFERERILILANATAQEAILKAYGEAQAKIIVAEATREAIENIMKSAGVTNSTRIAELYLWVETMKQLKITTFIVVTGPEGVPIIYQIPTNSTSG